MKNIYLNIRKYGLTGVLFLLFMLVSQVSWGQSYSDGYPTYSNVTENSVSIDIKFSVTGWYSDIIILPATETAPSIQNVIDWSLDGNGGTLDSGTWGEVITAIGRSGPTVVSFAGSNLNSGTDYIAYIVTSEDWTTSTAVETVEPTQVEFTTTSSGTPPTISTYYPADDATNIDPDGDLYLVFNEDIAQGSGYLNIYDSNSVLTYQVLSSNVTISNDTLTVSGATLDTNTSYYVTIDEGFVVSSSTSADFGGISDTEEWTFTTASAPSISAYSPTQGEENVALDGDLELTFNENIQFVESSEALLRIHETGGTTVQLFDVDASNITISNNTLTISANDLSENEKYYITIGDGFLESTTTGADFGGISDTTQWYFTTTSLAPTTTFTPDSAETDVSISTDIIITYDKAIRNATDTTELTDTDLPNLITLLDKDSNTIDFSATISDSTITITPTSNLSPNDTITVTIAAVANEFGVTQTEDQTCIFYTANYNIWTGASDTDYSKSANYKDGYTAGASTIVEAGGQTLIYSSNILMPELIIEPLAAVTINSGVTVTLENELLLESDITGSASLINNGTINTSSSNINVEQYTLGTSAYSCIGSLVSSSSFSDAGGDGYCYYWNDTLGEWSNYGSSATMSPGQGYMTTSSNKLTYNGSLNNSSSYTLTAEGTTSNSGYGLVANPYTASIDWDSLSDNIDTTTTRNAFYIYVNGFTVGTYNGISKAQTNLDSSNPSLIPSGQAFWIRANWIADSIETVTGSVTISRSDLVHNQTTYLKSETASSEYSSIRLVGIHNDLTDENLIMFKDGASADFDKYDTQKLFTNLSNNVLELYTVADSKNLAINMLPYTAITDTTIALGYKVKTSGSFEIQLSEKENMPDDLELILTDTDSDTETDLTSTGYSFTSDAANNTSRFYLTIKSSNISTDIEDNSSTSNENINIYSAGKTIHIKIGDIENAEYNIYNMAGNLIKTDILNPDSDNQAKVNQSGIYIVNVVNQQNNISKKIVIE